MRLDLPSLGDRNRVVLDVDEDVVAVFGRIANYAEQISNAEAEAVKRAVPKRKREFSTGRYFARLAQESLGLEPMEVQQASNRRPLWPHGVVGSISHSDALAMVILSRSEDYSGIGIDMEREGRVTASLVPMILTEREVERLPSLRGLPSPETLIFSAKESVYKAVNPIVGLMIDFREVEIHFDDRSPGSFEASYIGPNAQNRILERGMGSFVQYEDHLITTFVVQ